MAETNHSESWGESGDTFSQNSTKDTQKPHTETSRDARNLAMLCHLLGIVGFIAPLVIWLSERDKHRFVNEHGLAAMNYQISIMIYFAVSGLLSFVFIGLFMMSVLTIAHLVLSIIGAIKAYHGQPWRYPIAIPLLQ